MANLIQATVYQIDGSPLPSAITLDFQTSNLVIREATVTGFAEINSAILYYNVPNNQLSVQTFYVGEVLADLVDAANVGSTTQLQATVLEINEDPQVPGGVQYSFPANEILVGESVNAVTGVNSYIQFKNVRYFVSELQADLLVSGNGASAYKVYTALLTQSGGDAQAGINWDDPSPALTIGVTYTIQDNGSGLDMTNVGAPNNNINTSFVATGTTPNSWGEGVVIYNTGAPVVTVLENTIGNIYWQFATDGLYVGFLPDGLVTEGKQIVLSIPYSSNTGVSEYYTAIGNNTVDGEVSISTSGGLGGINDALSNFSIEIRVYN